jgi:hypothetical protein
VEQALGGALLRSLVQSDKEGVAALKDSLAEAMGKFVPDRTVLPIPDNLLVLIDDAGFGQPDTFGGPIPTPNMTRVQKQGLTYNRFHVTALCSPTRAGLA